MSKSSIDVTETVRRKRERERARKQAKAQIAAYLDNRNMRYTARVYKRDEIDVVRMLRAY
jgi:hypothetical protein